MGWRVERCGQCDFLDGNELLWQGFGEVEEFSGGLVTELIEEDGVDGGVRAPGQGYLNLDVPFDIPGCIKATRKCRETLGGKDGPTGGVDNGDGFGAAHTIPVTEVKREAVRVTVSEIEVDGEGRHGGIVGRNSGG